MDGKDKEYRGRIGARGERGVEVGGEDGIARPLLHIVHRSPRGFGWGWLGPGAADLALSILADALDERPSPADLEMGRSFASQHHLDYAKQRVAALARDEPFTIRYEDVEAWLLARGVDASRPTHITLLLPMRMGARDALSAALFRAGEQLFDEAHRADDEKLKDELFEASYELHDASTQSSVVVADRG